MGSIMDRSVITLALAALAIATLAPRDAGAHPWGDKTVGLGLTFYKPTGLTADFRFSDDHSLDLTVGLHTFDQRRGGYAHLQYLVRPFDLTHDRSLYAPVYLGLGPYVYDRDRNFDDDVHLGLRVPLGLALEFRPPIQLFFELALRVPLLEVRGDRDRSRGHDLGGALGLRLYF